MPLCKTVLIYVILSEEPVDGEDLSTIARKVETGEYVSKLRSSHDFELSGERMIAELEEAGVEPNVFGLGRVGDHT